MIHGAELPKIQVLAKALVQRAFVARAEGDGVPATLRAMYVRKAEEARTVLAGGTSPLITGEAAIRGITPEQMAQLVISAAASGGDDLELERMRLNVEIDAASDPAAVVAILRGAEIDFEHHDENEQIPAGPTLVG